MFKNHRNEGKNSKAILIITDPFIVTKAQKEEATYSNITD